MDWFEPQPIEIDTAYRAAIGGNPLVAEILYRRGFTDALEARSFLDPAAYTPAPPTEFPDLAKAAQRLLKAIEAGQQVLVWGDFDVDGQTATSLLVDGLLGLGAKVRFHVPDRMTEGHGIALGALRGYLNADPKPAILLSCDTGIAAFESIDAAHAAGLDVLVTDHHAIAPEGLPKNAHAIVSTQRLPKGHVLRDLPGVGVAYKLMQHLYALAGRSAEVERLLDLVALGIVADVVPQRHDTRYLLQRGMEVLKNTQRAGLRALMEAADVQLETLSTDTIGFQIGPRLNALGRLDNATLAVELLTTSQMAQARAIAEQLNLLNDKRKQIENQIYAAAQDQIAADSSLLSFEALVVAGPNWHPGVVGIVASRLVEAHGLPTVVLSTDGALARGSARSIPGVDIGGAIALAAQKAKISYGPEETADDLLLRYGGHPGAAGVALETDRIDQFRRLLSRAVAESRDPDVRVGHSIDASVSLSDLTMSLAEELNRLAPFGAGNPPVQVMVRDLRMTTSAVFGADKKHRRITVQDAQGIPFDVTWWRGNEKPEPPARFDLLVIPRINDWKGSRRLQLEWLDARPVPGVEIIEEQPIRVIDLRAESEPFAKLPAGAVLWAEGAHLDLPALKDRSPQPLHALGPAEALVIYSAPPGPSELEAALEATGARVICVIGQEPGDDGAESFLRRLGGLVKYALNQRQGKASLRDLAGRLAQRRFTVQRGLEYLEALGQIDLAEEQGATVLLKKGGAAASKEKQEAAADALGALLAEARAFRRFFRSADLSHFFRR